MLDHLISLIEREMDSVRHAILTGSCPDYTSYREQVATLHALQLAIDLAKRALAEDDDES